MHNERRKTIRKIQSVQHCLVRQYSGTLGGVKLKIKMETNNEEWKSLKLKYFLNIQKGKNPLKFSGEAISLPYLSMDFLRGKNKPFYIFPQENLVEVKENDCLVLWDGANAGEIMKAKDGYLSSTMAVLRIKSDLLENSFFFYFLKSNESIFKKDANGTTIPHFDPTHLLHSSFLIPSLYTQTAIANFLDYKTAKIDRFIRKKKQLIKLLNEQKAGIINDAVTKGLNPNAKTKPSGIEWLGDIPQHWEVRKLKYLGKFQNGISAGAEYFGTGYPFISYGDVYKNFELPKTGTGLANSSESDRINYSVKKGDIFFTRTSETIEEIGFTSTCLHTIEDATFSGFIIRFRPYENILFDGFSKYFFRSNLHRRFFVKEMNLVTRASLSQELLKRLPVLLPPTEEQHQIFAYIEKETAIINKTIATIEKEIALVHEYRTAIIAEVVTGKIDVREYAIPENLEDETHELLEEELSMAADEEVDYNKQEAE